ncbi:MAG TPA: hypothetical protein VK641_15105 [Terriglobales bacterium]|nr:hypothetical protein [Terriglobales bacterium]
MAQAQKTRWASIRKGAQHVSGDEENNRLNDCEAHHVGISPQENRGCSKSAVGEVQGAAKEGGVGPEAV